MRYSAVKPTTPYANVGFIYMGHDEPVTSRRLEAYREGWEDYKLLWTIRQAAGVDGQDQAVVERALAHISSAVDEILGDKDRGDVLLGWRKTLLEDATELCAAAPLDVTISEVTVTRNSAVVKCSASRPVRMWTWLDREPDEFRFIESAPATTDPVVTLEGLVAGETCKVTLVFAGPEGQHRVLTREITTEGWDW